MKPRLSRWGAAAALSSLLVASAGATTITGPVNLSSFTSGATYGPPAPAHFTDGPITIASGTTTPFFTGPNYTNVNSILLVISGTIPAGDIITLTYDSLAPVTFLSSNFVSTAAAGFPSEQRKLHIVATIGRNPAFE